MWVFEVIVSLCFLTDVVLSFRTAFESNGSWVENPKAIAQNYLRGWFWIDAPSSVPLELLDLLVDTSHFTLMRLLRLFRLLRLLKILKINDLIEKMEDMVRAATSAWAHVCLGRRGR